MMQLICISRGTLAGGIELAERLAASLGSACLSREDIVEAAVKEGIQVGKIETTMLKPGVFSERLALEREHYVAFTTAYICGRALKGPLVYHGRAGHLVLPRIGHVLRVRVIADREYRIKAAMQKLGLDRAKARRYVDEVDEDRRRWVSTLYGVSWDDASNYDFIVNLERMGVGNAAAALTTMVQLPDFQITPASRKAMENLLLGAQARVRLAQDERTFNASFKVRAADGVVTVTYLPQDARLAPAIPEALASLAGVREIRTTLATSNILWIQEAYDPASAAFRNVVEIAAKWDAAVELVRLTPTEASTVADEAAGEPPGQEEALANAPTGREYNGGVEEDVEEAPPRDDGGLKKAVEELSRLGRSGGGRAVSGSQDRLLETLDRKMPYTMVVVGDLFLAKGHAARLRLTRELRSFLSDNLKAPVVGTEDLKAQFLFGPRDLLRVFGYLAVTLVIYLVVFANQKPIQAFLAGTHWKAKTLAAVAVFLFVPVVAYVYGTLARLFLKLIKIE